MTKDKWRKTLMLYGHSRIFSKVKLKQEEYIDCNTNKPLYLLVWAHMYMSGYLHKHTQTYVHVCIKQIHVYVHMHDYTQTYAYVTHSYTYISISKMSILYP